MKINLYSIQSNWPFTKVKKSPTLALKCTKQLVIPLVSFAPFSSQCTDNFCFFASFVGPTSSLSLVRCCQIHVFVSQNKFALLYLFEPCLRLRSFFESRVPIQSWSSTFETSWFKCLWIKSSVAEIAEFTYEVSFHFLSFTEMTCLRFVLWCVLV